MLPDDLETVEHRVTFDDGEIVVRLERGSVVHIEQRKGAARSSIDYTLAEVLHFNNILDAILQDARARGLHF